DLPGVPPRVFRGSAPVDRCSGAYPEMEARTAMKAEKGSQRPPLSTGRLPEPIPLSRPVLTPEDIEVVTRVLESGWLTMGPKVEEFEQAFAQAHGHERATAVASCTAGLHLALMALDIGPGDEVIIPSLTFVAAANTVAAVGATPVVADIVSLERPHLDPASVRERITARTKAVMIMHYAGYMSDPAPWRELRAGRGLKIIEDAAHAPLAPGAGSVGDVTVFSFFSNKNMTTAEGGMILASDEALLERCRLLRCHGMTSATYARHSQPLLSYDVTAPGLNCRLDEIRAALGISQLSRLSAWNAERGRLSTLYRSLLAEDPPDVRVPFAPDHPSCWHIMPVLVPEGADRDRVRLLMRDMGIQTSMHYPPIHSFSCYSKMRVGSGLPRTEAFSGREITLPLYPGLADADVGRVVALLEEALTLSRRETGGRP
ncbi:MAG: DegT/DnrJ/EryC1/StrS aminotransferase family protein, partial [Humidesulfovibrio sp.]|nr:DegT/DnrJ/EryC1/StrS aminotransferase family protein [Humidesulfovibrio sp.]